MLVQQVLICEGNKPQIQSNHIIIHQKNLFFLLKAGPSLKCKFTKSGNAGPVGKEGVLGEGGKVGEMQEEKRRKNKKTSIVKNHNLTCH